MRRLTSDKFFVTNADCRMEIKYSVRLLQSSFLSQEQMKKFAIHGVLNFQRNEIEFNFNNS